MLVNQFGENYSYRAASIDTLNQYPKEEKKTK